LPFGNSRAEDQGEMVFFVILGLMVLGDIAWWYIAHRRLPRRSLRILAGLFAGGQLAGLAMIFVSLRNEAMRFIDVMPRWASSMILVWHLLLLFAVDALESSPRNPRVGEVDYRKLTGPGEPISFRRSRARACCGRSNNPGWSRPRELVLARRPRDESRFPSEQSR
jgi:hypothetical protein